MLGAMRVESQLDWEGRRVIVRETLGESSRFHLVETDQLTFCTLPQGDPINRPMHAPSFRGAGVPKVLVPLRRGRGKVEEDVEELFDLYFFDEKCAQHGPYGELGPDPDVIKLRADGRDVVLVRDAKNSLRLLDPWTEKSTPIADQVAGYATVARAESGPRARDPEALWLLEAGKLTQRGYDGTLLVSMGENVSTFVQTLAASANLLRVAFLQGPNDGDGGELYEAVSPSYAPVRIANEACGPEYVDTALDVRTPCRKGQLVRIEAGQVRFFAEGVTRIFPQGDITFEQVNVEEGDSELWVSRKDGRAKITPTPRSSLVALDSERYAGRAATGQFGAWTLRAGFVPVLSNVRETWFFPSRRRWLVLHDVQDEARTGRLSSFSEPALLRALEARTEVALETLSVGTPSDGYRSYAAPGLSEPIIISYADARVQRDQDPAIRGRLIARVLSNKLGSIVDENVSSFTMVVAPQPGVLYAITEGPRSGLWFAAL